MKFIIILAVFLAGTYAHCDYGRLIKAAWDQVKHSEVDILYNVFKEYPEIQAYFPKFVGKDLEKVKGTAPFALHATRIISFMSEIINLMEDHAAEPAIKGLIIESANKHKNRGISKELFDKFDAAILKYLKTHATFDEQTENAWHAVAAEHNAIIYPILEGKAVN